MKRDITLYDFFRRGDFFNKFRAVLQRHATSHPDWNFGNGMKCCVSPRISTFFKQTLPVTPRPSWHHTQYSPDSNRLAPYQDEKSSRIKPSHQVLSRQKQYAWRCISQYCPGLASYCSGTRLSHHILMKGINSLDFKYTSI